MGPRLTGGDIPTIEGLNPDIEDNDKGIDEEEAFNRFLILKIDQTFKIRVRNITVCNF